MVFFGFHLEAMETEATAGEVESQGDYEVRQLLWNRGPQSDLSGCISNFHPLFLGGIFHPPAMFVCSL